ncbi:acyl-CoA thioesterase II [Rhodococcus pseudokoreensis]|uniref:Acyl-CoA thioesterase II n=1 Tax=Rhodococcus pseudokoreensis TaxID=2811421 RepID=A0A974W6A4_9NOCA|nr:acyl-CoA thioesterase II [Rhodococcus pseudokoreensis]
MTSTVAEVVGPLTLEEIAPHTFRGPQPDEDRQRVFGGQVAAQALMAASHTVQGRVPHSLHGYFLRPGNPTVPIVYTVDCLRDGGAFSARRITATQDGTAVFEALVSFSAHISGIDYQEQMPAVPQPDSLVRIEAQLAPYADEYDGWWIRRRPFDMRYVNAPPRVALDLDVAPPPQSRLWLRPDGEVPNDPIVNSCLLTFVSDLTLLDSVMLPARKTSRGPGIVASLDHAIWFHRSANFSDWLLYEQNSPNGTCGRGLASGRIFNRSGALVATVMQEGYLGKGT